MYIVTVRQASLIMTIRRKSDNDVMDDASKSADRGQGLTEKDGKKPKRVRDTSLWKFHHTDGREVWGISPMCPDIGSACYSRTLQDCYAKKMKEIK